MEATNRGNCGKCNSEHIEYGTTRLEGESLGYEYHCDTCNTNGIEWYNLTYDITT